LLLLSERQSPRNQHAGASKDVAIAAGARVCPSSKGGGVAGRCCPTMCSRICKHTALCSGACRCITLCGCGICQETSFSTPWEIGFLGCNHVEDRDATPVYLLYELVQPWPLHPCILSHAARNLDTSALVPATMGQLFVSCSIFVFFCLPAVNCHFVMSLIVHHSEGQY